MSRATRLLGLLVIFAGCRAGRGLVVLTVEGHVTKISTLRVVAQLGGVDSLPADFAPPSAPFDLPQTLALWFDPDRSGPLRLGVTALDGNGGFLEFGAALGTLTPGEETDLTVTLGGPRPDGGASDGPLADLPLGDAATGDLAGADLAGADLAFGGFTSATIANTIPAHAIALGYVDADPSIDLVLLDDVQGRVQVLIGQGGGNFKVTPPFTTGLASPAHLVTGHFDADAVLDLAVSSTSGGKVATYRGNGNGTFVAGTVIVRDGVGPMVFAPLEANAGVTLAMASQTDKQVSFSDPDLFGTFGAPQSIALGGPVPIALIAAPLDGDQFVDLLVVNQGDGTLSKMINNNNGTFGIGNVPMVMASQPHAAVAGAFEHNGIPELALAEVDKVSTYTNDGLGNIKAKWSAMLNGPGEIATGEFNGDGILDLAVTLPGQGMVAIFLGKGDASFAPVQQVGVPLGANGIVAADFDGDGRDDLAVTSISAEVGILLSR